MPTHSPLLPSSAGDNAPRPLAGSSERRWRLLSELGQALSGELDARQVLREMAARMVPDLADYCVTYLVEGASIERVGAAHADPAQEGAVQRLVRLAPPSLQDETGAGAAIRTGQAILSPEIAADLLERSARDSRHLQTLRVLRPISSMVLPLRARGRTVGAVALATTDRSKRRYDANELQFVQELADRAALALDNARLYGEAALELQRRRSAEDALRVRYEQLRVLYDVNEAVGRATAIQEIYGQALDALRRTLQVDRTSILLFDADGVMRFKAWRGLSDGYRAAVEGHSPWSVDTRSPSAIFVSDVKSDSSLGDSLKATVLAEGIRSLAFVPLVFGGRLLGKFMLYYDEPHDYQQEELELARTVANTIAFAITRTRDEQSIRQAKEETEHANEAKSRFLGVMSHELRTPLNAIGGYVELLDLGIQGPTTPKQREALARIAANQRHLLGLINDILSFARLEAGQVEYDLQPVGVAQVLTSLEALIAPLATAKGTAYVLDECDESLEIMADEERLRQILVNLVGNAIKFAPAGGWVRVSCDAELGHLSIRVRDNGPGIPTDKQETIFEPFIQVEIDPRATREGAGLGLAISRELARGMGGDIRIDSVPGEGSEFALRLPLATLSATDATEV